MPVQLTVNGIGGLICSVRAESSWTGFEIKQAIEKASGIPVSEQLLLNGASELRNGDQLRCVGETPTDITLVRRRRITLQADASADQWLALYFYDYGKRPSDPTALRGFAQNRGGRISFQEARAACKLYADPSVSLVDLPAPAEPPQPSPPPPAASNPDITSRNGAVNLATRYLELGSLAPGEICAICFEEGGEGGVELLCGGRHRFHKICIEEWFNGAEQVRTAGQYPNQPVLHALASSASITGSPVERHTSGARKGGHTQCPMCKGEALGKSIEAKTSGVFQSQAAQSRADAGRARQKRPSWMAASSGVFRATAK